MNTHFYNKIIFLYLASNIQLINAGSVLLKKVTNKSNRTYTINGTSIKQGKTTKIKDAQTKLKDNPITLTSSADTILIYDLGKLDQKKPLGAQIPALQGTRFARQTPKCTALQAFGIIATRNITVDNQLINQGGDSNVGYTQKCRGSNIENRAVDLTITNDGLSLD